MQDYSIGSALPGMCHDCAFRPGTDASTYAPTRLKARLCSELGEPFYCHERIGPNGEPIVCSGFAHGVRIEASPDKATFNVEQRKLASNLLSLVNGKPGPSDLPS